MARKKHRLPRVFTRSVGLALVFAGAAGATIKFFIAPCVIRSQANSHLFEQWDGRAEIKPIGFNWGGIGRG